MTLPSVIRIFFAIDLPPVAKKELGKFIHDMKQKAKSKVIRWTNPDNLHITLQFLAEIHTEDLSQLIKNVRTEIEGMMEHTTLALGALHLFPHTYRPRVIVLDITPQEKLSLISEAIGRGIKSVHYEIETRPFRGHLTLGRIKQPQGVNLQFLSEFSQPILAEIDLKEVVLFRSEPKPQGSQYTVLERIQLTKLKF